MSIHMARQIGLIACLVFDNCRIFAAIGLLFLHKPSNCSELQWLLFPIVLIVVNLVSGVLCIALSISSAKGSILEMHKRRNVVRIIYTRVPILILEIISTGAVALYAFGTFVCVVFFYSNTLGFITTDECVSRLSLFLTLAFELGLITCCLLVVGKHTHAKIKRLMVFL